ncbi:type III restriction enzyme, res subunit [Roseovarius sp. A-2]|uniref:DEAD/DEAH box helicase n=1 Tax=Roseovarius sp. A-2 TaxID=1570360 RepID=UPI0009B52F54|nr:DEAD/DEAH box helicase family protein [Roseovarius sp. A-2]GAW36986.1 type III restriction enzyme, res subunit [Roseovarius sp. A-2]
MSVSLRPYQKSDVDNLRTALQGGARRVLFEASVGYGKSVVIEHLAAAYSAARRRVWVLSNRSAVVGQLRDRAGGMPGVEVMTVQAADRRRAALAADPAHLVLADEIHMGGSGPQYGRVFDCAPGATVIGFTGSPRGSTFEVLPAHVPGRDAAWLTQQGYLSPLRYVCPDVLDMKGVRKRNGDFDPAAAMARMEEGKIFGKSLETWREFALGQPSLGFCVNVKHAMETADAFRRAGHKCEVLVGKDSDDEVREKIAFLADGGLVFSVDKVSAGFDLPDLRAIISLRPSESEQLWVQQLGRVARAADGKDFGLVLDHVGNGDRLGTLTEKRDWRNLSKTRGQRKAEDGSNLATRTCEECYHLFEAGPKKCPQCGAALEKDRRIPADESVRLRAIEADELEARRSEAKALRKRQGQSIRQMSGWLGFDKAVANMKARHARATRQGDDLVREFAERELRSYGRAP